MTTETKPKALLDTAVAESLWTGGQGAEWIERVANGEIEASLCAASVVELVQKAPDRRAEIQLAALVAMVAPIDLRPCGRRIGAARSSGWKPTRRPRSEAIAHGTRAGRSAA